MAIWDDVISKSDMEVYWKAGYGTKKIDFGNRPALVIIDVSYNFTGDKPEPILQSIERFPMSCGEYAWKAVRQIASLLPLAWSKLVPVIYTTYSPKESTLPRKWSKNPKSADMLRKETGHEIVREIAPQADDIIIYKFAPSIFFGTPLTSILTTLKIDTLLVCGGSTSGCVRASVTEAASYGFTAVVIEECTFDRWQTSHKVNLFDMDAKYARVASVTEVRDYLSKLTG